MSDGERKRVGKFLGVPYDWRRPTKARFKSRWWNPDDPRFVPMAKRLLPIFLLLLAVTCLPQPAAAEPNLKSTHECYSPLNGVGGDPFNAVGGVRANTETSCMVAIKAIHHGHLAKGRFQTKRWICKRQGGLGPEVEGERVKCRRGTKEAFEFAWATRGG